MTRYFVLMLTCLAVLGCDAPNPAQKPIVLWHAYRGAEADALVASAERYNELNPQQRLRLVALPYDAFANKLRVAVPRGNGPDLFIFAHDQVGDWARGGLIEPLDYWLKGDELNVFLDETLNALVYHNTLYGLPMGFKTLALYYDTTLVTEAPTTSKALLQTAKSVAERSAEHWGIGFAVDSFYYHAPWLHAFDGQVLDKQLEVRVDSPGMRASLSYMRRLLTDGLMPKGAAAAQIAALFKQRKLAFVIDGPWFENALRDHANWGVAPLPDLSETGKALKPFLGVEALMLSARSPVKEAALAAARFITSDSEALSRWSVGRQLVANRAVYDRADVRNDPFAKAFRTQLSRTQPLSNDPMVRHLWSPLSRLLSQTIVRGKPFEKALLEADKAIRKASQ